jgi:wobble nucleotide-excising tRNase
VLTRISQLSRVGRFAKLDAPRFARLTLIYGRNASGKSTISRVLAAAGRQSAEVALDRTLAHDDHGGPELALEVAGGVARFAANAWTGVAPKISVFDRGFVERNVYIGRRSTKEHRKELLRLALGGDDATTARELDDISQRGRKAAAERTQRLAVIDAAASSHGLLVAELIALAPVADAPAARASAERALEDARRASEIVKRPRPAPLPVMPEVDADGIAAVLARDTHTLGTDAARQVRAHLDGRLRGAGESWLRDGLAHVDGKTCPFCAQPASALMDLYGAWFDAGYEQLVGAIAARQARLAALVEWWRGVAQAGRANLAALDAWNDVGAARPSFDSATRKAELDAALAIMKRLLDAKREQPTRVVDGAELAGVAPLLASLGDAVARYNEAVAHLDARIDARLAELRTANVDAAARAVRHLDAAVVRHAEPVARAVGELDAIERELAELRARKKVLAELVKQRAADKLAGYTTRINALLRRLGADFELLDLGTERGGGAIGSRFTLKVETGELDIASSSGEERFARVLSDGDRATLAFAVFVLAVEQLPDLAQRVVVFDDPMTSLDAQRAQATAEQIARLAERAGQIIVLSHDESFLRRVAAGRPGDDVVALELDKASRALVPWRASE